MFAAALKAVRRSTLSVVQASRRLLNLHEYQSKQLLDRYNINVQRWRLATSVDEATAAVNDLKAKQYVVKAQVHAGGRGAGVFENGFRGGVKVCSGAEVPAIAKAMLGHRLITKQTGADGVLVSKLMIAESLQFDKETYFALLLDRAFGGPVAIASPMGGMDIEEVAVKHPQAIFKLPIDIRRGMTADDARVLAEKLGFGQVSAKAQQNAEQQLQRLYELFVKSDATQVEINPLVVTADNSVYCIDAKINFDDNAEFRQREVFGWRDDAETDPREVAAQQYALNYIGMDGNIGCMVNGAGLAMATMDIIKLHGGQPANFLDVGGGANEKQVTEAFKIISSDPKVQAILVNIFGGIMKCDIIAQGIINACKEIGLKLPLVVRLAGTNVEKGKEILKNSGLNITSASDLDDAAKKAVAQLKH